MGNKTIDVNNVDGIVNAENGVVINQYFYYDTSKNNDSIDNKKSKKIEEYPFYRNIEKDKYICQKGKILIEANLPKINFPMSFLIECKISFKLENNRTIIVKLDNEGTLKEIFSLYRYFFKDKDKDEQDNTMITYTSNHVTLDISMGTFNTLIHIANDLQEVYTERINQLEEKLESKNFSLSKEYQNGFELCEISYKLFIKIQEFMQKHIMYKTSNRGEWDIFVDSNHSSFIWTRDTIIDSRIKYTYDIDVKEPIRIVLVWDTLNFCSYESTERKILTVKEAYNWLTEKLINVIKDEIIGDIEKYSIEYYNIMDEYFKLNDFYDEFNEKYENKEFIAIREITNSLDKFYKSINFTEDNLKNVYESLILLLENSKWLDIDGLKRLFFYIGNINTIPVYSTNTKVINPTEEYFINRINIELEEIKKGNMSMNELIGDRTYTLREIFNCYEIIFNTNKEDDYPDIVIHEVYQKLKSFTVIQV